MNNINAKHPRGRCYFVLSLFVNKSSGFMKMSIEELRGVTKTKHKFDSLKLHWPDNSDTNGTANLRKIIEILKKIKKWLLPSQVS